MSAGAGDPSYEELAALVVAQARQIERLEAEVAELRRRLGLNSSNSSRPPSSDGLAKPPPRSLRRPSGRRAGKQPGDPGTALSQVDDPDEVIVHRPERCRGCRESLTDAVPVSQQRRQVFDLPRVQRRVTEHRLVTARCACGAVTTAAAPPGVSAPVQYGPRMAAAAAYLAVGQHLPQARTAQILADLLGGPVSTGWIATVLNRTATVLTGFKARLQDAIGRAVVVHFDETGVRAQDRLRWVHVACTPTLTSYHLHDRRGQTAIDDHGVLPALRAGQIAVHDGWLPYQKTCYQTVDHALCNAHHLRELTGWAETSDTCAAWANPLIALLKEGYKRVCDARTAGRQHLPAAVLDDLMHRWDQAITHARTANPPPPTGKARGKPLALIDRLRGGTPEVWRFAHDFHVPFDNNQAERDLRMVKLQPKISGAWRTTHGARTWLTIREYLSTTRKNGIQPLQALHDALTGNAWLPPLPE